MSSTQCVVIGMDPHKRSASMALACAAERSSFASPGMSSSSNWSTDADRWGEDHTRMISQLHQVRPRDLVGKTRRRVAVEPISDLQRIHARKKAANKELTALLAETGTTLTDLPGIGPYGAARVLVEVGDEPGRATEKRL